MLYGDKGFFAFEIKRTMQVKPSDMIGLQVFKQDYPESTCYLIHGGHERGQEGNIHTLPMEHCLKSLLDVLT